MGRRVAKSQIRLTEPARAGNCTVRGVGRPEEGARALGTKMGEEARECAFLVEVGGILDGSGRGMERGTI